MAARFDMLLEHWLLRYKVRLREKKMLATAIGRSLRTLRASALDKKSTLGPKFTLVDDLLLRMDDTFSRFEITQKED